MKPLIHTSELTKRYRDITAVVGLSLTVHPGEIYGFLGLNGAGKTTTIRMLLGLLRPTAGRATVLDTDVRPGNREPWSDVGYLVETPRAYPELTVRENLEIVWRLRRLPDPGAIDAILDQLGLMAYADKKTGTLSLGNAQRLGLAKALMHSPRLLILDEPSNGLDPAGIVEIRELLKGLAAQRGVTIFMSSHLLGEVSRMATRIGIIHEGRLVMERTSSEIDAERRSRLVFGAKSNAEAMRALRSAGFDVSEDTDGFVEVRTLKALEHPEQVAQLLVDMGHPPTMIRVEREDLESYFLRLVAPKGGKPN